MKKYIEYCINIIKKIKSKAVKKFKFDYRRLGKKYRRDPIDIYAFIRVKNEIITIDACLKSILPVINKGVIGYNKLKDEIDDGTEEYILKFCEENKGFIPFRYEYDVIPANDLRYKNLDEISAERRLDTYYNEVLKKIPQDKWVMKIDCDHVFDIEKLSNLRYIPKNDTEAVVLSRMNMHYEKDELYFVNIHTIVGSGEWILLKNNNLTHKFKTGYRDDGSFFAWEYLDISNKKLKFVRTDLFNWHFPFIKNSRKLDGKYFTKFDKFKISNKINKDFGIKDDMLDKGRILNICKTFRIKS